MPLQQVCLAISMSLPSYGCVYCILLVSFFGVVAAVVVFIRHHMSLMSNKRMSVVGWSWGARIPGCQDATGVEVIV